MCPRNRDSAWRMAPALELLISSGEGGARDPWHAAVRASSQPRCQTFDRSPRINPRMTHPRILLLVRDTAVAEVCRQTVARAGYPTWHDCAIQIASGVKGGLVSRSGHRRVGCATRFSASVAVNAPGRPRSAGAAGRGCRFGADPGPRLSTLATSARTRRSAGVNSQHAG